MMIKEYTTPLGTVYMAATGGKLCVCSWNGLAPYRRLLYALSDKEGGHEEDERVLMRSERALEAYFAGKLKDFDIPLNLYGTPFQTAVWRALMEVPYGTTESYGSLARRLGNPLGVRAVARACGANPIAIFVPCHRIVGADGRLTGYAGGIEKKKALLDLESFQLRP